LSSPILGAIRWLLRHAVYFLVAALVFMLGHWLLEQWQAVGRYDRDLRTLSDLRPTLHLTAKSLAEQAAARTNHYRAQALSSAQDRIARIDEDIARKLAQQHALAPHFDNLLSGRYFDRAVAWTQLELEVAGLRQERQYLFTLTPYLATKDRLEELRLEHLMAYQRLLENRAQQATVRAESPLLTVIPSSAPHQELKRLQSEESALYAANQRAYDSYSQQLNVTESNRRLIVDARSYSDAVLAKANELEADVEGQMNTLQNARDEVETRVRQAATAALWVVAGLIFMPLLIRAVFYFALAPLAARRPPILLMPGADGSILVCTGGERSAHQSQVSLPIIVDAHSDLLVKPGFLHSSSVARSKTTQWLLNREIPLGSLLSGMVALTRIRSDRPETVVLSAGDDPLCELAALDLPAGAQVVLRPRCLVGIRQPRDRPVTISRHWRILSLHAWLTLQFRYLVFQGPCTLIVKGCRGVRIEASGAGRRINQAATIGFSANLAYSTIRNETFVPYARAQEPLLDDAFAGEGGYIIYEETPRNQRPAGLAGRQLEAGFDAVLKIFGL